MGTIASALLIVPLASCSKAQSPAAPTVTVSSVAVSGSTGTAVAGQTVALVATATYSDNTTATVTAQAAWESTNTVVATVSPTGMVTFLAAGGVDVRATFRSVVGSTRITVSPPAPTLTAIAVTGVAGAATVGNTGSLTATATYSNGTTANVTNQAAWSTSNAGVATVSATGAVAFVGAGDVDLRATFSGITGSLRVAVSSVQTFRSIDGVVRDSVSSQPIADALVQVRGGGSDGRSTRTNGSGAYTLANLVTGSLTLEFAAGLYAPASMALTLSDDTRVDVTMTPSVGVYYGKFTITLGVTQQTCVPPVALPTPWLGTLELAGQSNGTGLTVKITERDVSRTYSGGRMGVDGKFSGSLPAGTLFPGAIRPQHEVSASMQGTVSGSSIVGTESMNYTSGCQPGAFINISFSGAR